jgi:putative transposase
MAETKKEALKAFDAFVETYGAKYEKAVERLTKDRDALPAFYDFPAEHWTHLRTSNPIESTFATVRHRTVRSKGVPLEQDRAGHDVQTRASRREKLAPAHGHAQLAKVILGVKFNDGIEAVREEVQAAT